VKRALIALGVLAILASAGAAFAWWWNERETRDIRGSRGTEFVATEVPGASTTTVPTETKGESEEQDGDESRAVVWPTYGLDPARTRYAPDFRHRPPYRKLWSLRALNLVEFPPVIAYGRLYFSNTAGRFFAVDAETGEVVWSRLLRRGSGASPTVADGVVYHPLMNARGEARESAPGFMVALDAETGKTLWRFRAGAMESSPLYLDGILYFGTFDNRLYALNTRTRRVRWSYRTGDNVKGGPAYAKGTIYFGSYDGNVYAVDARSGKLRWRSGAQGGLRGAGNFYATPAVAYGRVFIGNTDGKVYAFGARTGHLLWSRSTGGWVYSSPAVWNETVYAGSYDGRFYAFDAATGDMKWSFDAGGPISGAPTVMSGLVYFARLRAAGVSPRVIRPGRTYALNARTGKLVWTFPDGKYTPIVADEERVYLVGFTRVYGLQSRRS
jgi:outer membrane protein assembly factor BamB